MIGGRFGKYALSKFNQVELFVKQYPRISIATSVGLLLILLFNYYFLQPALFLYGESQNLNFKLKPIISAYKEQNLATLIFELQYSRKEVAQIQENTNRLGRLSFLPWVGAYFRDLETLGQIGITTYDNLLSFLVDSQKALLAENTSRPASTKIEKIARFLPIANQELPRLKPKLLTAANQFLQIDENRYPVRFRRHEIRAQMKLLKDLTRWTVNSFDDVNQIFEQLPSALGVDSAKVYLVLIQNNKELRSGGGRLGGYAFLETTGGNFHIVKSGDISFLDDQAFSTAPVPLFLKPLSPFSRLRLKDANYSPDFKDNAVRIDEIWQTTPKPLILEGIAAVDTEFLHSLISTLGEIRLSEKTVINDGNVEGFLDEFFQNIGRKNESAQRIKDQTSILLNELFKKALSPEGQNYFQLANTLLRTTNQKHLLFYSKNPQIQALIEKYNFGGRIQPTTGDYLDIDLTTLQNDRESWNISEEVKKQKENEIARSKIQIEFTLSPINPSASDKPLPIYLRIYTPLGSKLLNSTDFSRTEDLGKTVFVKNLELKPQQKENVEIEYELPAGAIKDTDNWLLIQKQAGTDNFPYEIIFDGKKTTLDLDRDKEFDHLKVNRRNGI